MTAPLNFTSTNANRGLGSSEASVERPTLRNSSNYVLRYCVSPELHENPTISEKKDVASNNLKSHRFKINRTQISAISAFKVVEFVRPLIGRCANPSRRASAASQSDKFNISPRACVRAHYAGIRARVMNSTHTSYIQRHSAKRAAHREGRYHQAWEAAKI
jgi:hypothetical protein